MSVRQLFPDDLQTFIELRLQAIVEFPDAFLLTYEEARTADLKHAAAWIESGQAYGYFQNGKLAGFAGLSQPRLTAMRHHATIGPFYVMPDLQGKGAAQALLDVMVSECAAKGITQLDLWVWSENRRAIDFYQRNGFRKTGSLPGAVIINGIARDDFLMFRALDR